VKSDLFLEFQLRSRSHAYEVATLAKELSGSPSHVTGETKHPKHQKVTDKIRALGMPFGGEELLRETVSQLVTAVQQQESA
jgi:hypothetical protein